MKLLLDQNLSCKLVKRLARVFLNSSHTTLCGLATATDDEVWMYARRHGFTIVTKDADFGFRSATRGSPPKVIWLRTGNTTTDRVEMILRARVKEIRVFGRDKKSGCLIINT